MSTRMRLANRIIDCECMSAHDKQEHIINLIHKTGIDMSELVETMNTLEHYKERLGEARMIDDVLNAPVERKFAKDMH